jgi:hypothetical protein
LPIKVRRGAEELNADIVNASQSGCLLLVPSPLEPGEVLGVNIPELMMPEARLQVLRCHPSPPGLTGYMVATCFESAAANETTLAEMSDKQNDPSLDDWVN